jgi:hypothetical protein
MELDYEDAKVTRRLEQAWAFQSRRRLWELMGIIGVVSQLGQGSVFSISPPIYSNLRFPPNSFRHGGPADRKDDSATHEKDSQR